MTSITKLYGSVGGMASKSLATGSATENESFMGSSQKTAVSQRPAKRPDDKPKQSCCRRPKRWVYLFSKFLCDSRVFSFITTLLTFYALFGDDIRLVSTDKPADHVFDIITAITMGIFAVEIVVFSVGKPGYLFGFFFILDIISTVTLVLDLTFVSSMLFDTIITSTDGESSADGGGGGGGNSADAARAARASRAGTKAGRVVRLIRLIRLIKMLKCLNKKKQSTSYEVHPGEDWDEDHWDNNVQESAVSKKLSEMTTRRVIMLVLAIMICLPFFQASFYTDRLETSTQYGMNVLYRKFQDDIKQFQPDVSDANRLAYLQSENRRVYEESFVFFVYHHNWFCEDGDVPSGTFSPEKSFGKLFWVGASPRDAVDTQYFLPRFTLGSEDWDSRWEGSDWDFYQCKLPAEVQSKLQVDWSDTTTCIEGTYKGVSLIESRESRVTCPDDLRYQERTIVYPQTSTSDEFSNLFFMFVFDRRSGSRMEAILNIGQTFFICLLLGVGAMTFSNDANKLVLMPIERMILKLERIRSNPLEATTIGDEEHHREWVQAKQKGYKPAEKPEVLHQSGSFYGKDPSERSLWHRVRQRACPCMKRKEAKEAPEPMETVVLEKTIIKIGSLLALGFGEAGAEIIGQNMKGSDSSAFNATIPGKRVEAIFGFCALRNFTDATEVLQDQVMIFVNRIAGVVHTVINEFFGSPNKNMGEAFLLVWRLSGHPPDKQERLADMSLLSFVKIIAQINKSPLLAEYRMHPKLAKKVPGYRVRMAFGLHSGWAIEGAIGSEFKIDASYLSPNVNMALRLETITKQYHTLILLSEALIKLMSEPIVAECRLIDHIQVAESTKPFKLYALDLDDLALDVDKGHPPIIVGKQQRFRLRVERMKKRTQRWADSFDMHSFFETDEDVRTMRSKYTQDFLRRFNMAYLNYEGGNWIVARDTLEVTRFLLSTEDGPSAALFKYIKQYDFDAPKGWLGYRMLDEK